MTPGAEWVMELTDERGSSGFLSANGTWANTIATARWFVSSSEAAEAELPPGVTGHPTRVHST